MYELHFYDFDGTLFRSPYPPAGWSGGWWNEVDSLVPPCVPDKPSSEWWIGNVVSQAKRSIANPNVYAVMATGRPAGSALRYRVPELLKQKGLNFDEVHLSTGDAVAFKKRLIYDLLKRYPFIEKVTFWDDQGPQVRHFAKVAERMGVDRRDIQVNLINVKAMPAQCGDLEVEVAGINPKKVKYIGLFLDSSSRAELVNRFPYSHDEKHADHMTMTFRPDADSPLYGMVGEKRRVKVIGYAEDGKAQAVLLDPEGLPVTSGVPHVTLSTAPGVAAKYSKELARDAEPTASFTLSGVIDTFPRSLKRK